MDSFTRKQNIKYILLIVVTTISVLALSIAYSGNGLKKEKNKINQSEFSVQDAYDFLKTNKDNGQVIALDIRTPGEYAEGHIAGSVHISYLADDFKKRLSSLDKSKTYLLFCKSGRVAPKVIKKMKKLGFKEAHRITGGMKEWKARNLPVDYSK